MAGFNSQIANTVVKENCKYYCLTDIVKVPIFFKNPANLTP